MVHHLVLLCSRRDDLVRRRFFFRFSDDVGVGNCKTQPWRLVIAPGSRCQAASSSSSSSKMSTVVWSHLSLYQSFTFLLSFLMMLACSCTPVGNVTARHDPCGSICQSPSEFLLPGKFFFEEIQERFSRAPVWLVICNAFFLVACPVLLGFGWIALSASAPRTTQHDPPAPAPAIDP